jgi:hypothetical protein
VEDETPQEAAEEPTPEVIITELDLPPDPPAEPPGTEMDAAYELGACMAEVKQLRREVAECREETRLSNAAAADLAKMVADLSSNLAQVEEEEVKKQEDEQTERRAHWLELMLGGGRS